MSSSKGSEKNGDVSESHVLCLCSEISEKLQNTNVGQDKPVKFKELFEEIFKVQQLVEKTKLFRTGQELYSTWLKQVLSINGDENFNCSNESKADQLISSPELLNVISRAYNNRGYLKYLQVDFEGAIQDYTKALKYDSTLACAYYNRGLVTYRLAFFQQSIEDMKEAVRLEPSEEFKLGLQRSEEAYCTTPGHSFNLEYNNEDSVDHKQNICDDF
ncbi:Tetratricopeptide repeat protein 32 [Orchesella cincta]|uniref:Tetratricopeptide repeat protein 32 n=1 Tax=Orchesella cincta TaxID=48709 RepID=A0A1D2MS31_ORCCI|nr:Tetratricopeptide repeat protein 32 [Orchesella cincta]